MIHAVFLDRDGVLNEAVIRNGKPHPPASVEELRVVPNAAEALQKLKNAGFLLIVVTNQPDVARGNITHARVEAVNAACPRSCRSTSSVSAATTTPTDASAVSLCPACC